MQVSEAMTREVRTMSPSDTIRDAAKMMAEIDAGAIPVGENDRLVGMITDRDIVVRALARGEGPDAPIETVMTREVRYCFDDDDLEDVCKNMADLQVRRLPVVNREKRLVGIVSLGDLARHADSEESGEALEAISRPGGSGTN